VNRAVAHLTNAILESVPRADVPDVSEPRWEKWCVFVDRLHRLDAWEWDQIHAVLDWLPNHERTNFRWGLVILSAKKLRQHFARLHAEMAAGDGGSQQWTQQPLTHPDPQEDA
jgi:hypothetical protein